MAGDAAGRPAAPTPGPTGPGVGHQRWPLLTPRRWARGYDRASLAADLTAGVTVAVMLIPQGMAYASLAGMPPVTGLYASIVPLLAYALLGTSGQLAMGPVAIVSLLTASAIAPLAGGDPASYAMLAAVLALLVGAVQLLLGLLRLGVLVDLLSHAVISGFTSAAAIVIALSQAKELLGIDIPRSERATETVLQVAGAISDVHPLTLALGAASIGVLLLARRFAPRLPAALLVVAAATAVVATAGLATRGVAILGEVPRGLPTPELPVVDLSTLAALLPSAVTIALIGYMEGVSVAKAIAARTRQPIDADRELVGTGAANLVAGLFQSFPVAGGFSRTAVNHQAGARTPMASLVTAGVIAIAVSLFTPLFFHLPKAVLAAVIVVAVVGLIDLPEAVAVWRLHRSDGVTIATTFLATLLLGVEAGLLSGVLLALGLLVWRTARPHTCELGRVEGTELLRNVRRFPARTDPAVAVFRVDGPLYFVSANAVERQVLALVANRPLLRSLVLDCSAITDLDTTGAHLLARLDRQLTEAGVSLHLATVRGPVRDLLRRTGGWTAMAGRIHPDPAGALSAAGVTPDSPLRSRAHRERMEPVEVV